MSRFLKLNTIHHGDSIDLLGNLEPRSIDMIFADPPYDLKMLENIPDLIFKNELLKSDGLFVMEHSSNNVFSAHPNYLDHRAYGNVNFSFFGYKPE